MIDEESCNIYFNAIPFVMSVLVNVQFVLLLVQYFVQFPFVRKSPRENATDLPEIIFAKTFHVFHFFNLLNKLGNFVNSSSFSHHQNEIVGVLKGFGQILIFGRQTQIFCRLLQNHLLIMKHFPGPMP